MPPSSSHGSNPMRLEAAVAELGLLVGRQEALAAQLAGYEVKPGSDASGGFMQVPNEEPSRPETPTIRTLLAGFDPEVDESAFGDWLARQGIKASQTFRIDIIGDEYFVVHRYKVDARGGKFVWKAGPNAGEVALEEPVAIRIIEPPPAGDPHYGYRAEPETA